MTFNKELANQVLEQIKKDPKSWNQDAWAQKTECGTAYCFAGWAVMLTDPYELVSVPCGCPYVDCVNKPVAYRNGKLVNSNDEALSALGLPPQNYFCGAIHPLFRPGNTFEDLERIVSELSAEA